MECVSLKPVAKLPDDGCGDDWNHGGFWHDAGHAKYIQGVTRISRVSRASKARRGVWQQALVRILQFIRFSRWRNLGLVGRR